METEKKGKGARYERGKGGQEEKGGRGEDNDAEMGEEEEEEEEAVEQVAQGAMYNNIHRWLTDHVIERLCRAARIKRKLHNASKWNLPEAIRTVAGVLVTTTGTSLKRSLSKLDAESNATVYPVTIMEETFTEEGLKLPGPFWKLARNTIAPEGDGDEDWKANPCEDKAGRDEPPPRGRVAKGQAPPGQGSWQNKIVREMILRNEAKKGHYCLYSSKERFKKIAEKLISQEVKIPDVCYWILQYVIENILIQLLYYTNFAVATLHGVRSQAPRKYARLRGDGEATPLDGVSWHATRSINGRDFMAITYLLAGHNPDPLMPGPPTLFWNMVGKRWPQLEVTFNDGAPFDIVGGWKILRDLPPPAVPNVAVKRKYKKPLIQAAKE